MINDPANEISMRLAPGTHCCSTWAHVAWRVHIKASDGCAAPTEQGRFDSNYGCCETAMRRPPAGVSASTGRSEFRVENRCNALPALGDSTSRYFIGALSEARSKGSGCPAFRRWTESVRWLAMASERRSCVTTAATANLMSYRGSKLNKVLMFAHVMFWLVEGREEIQ